MEPSTGTGAPINLESPLAFLADLPIKKKITVAALISCVVSLSLTAVVVILLELRSLRSDLQGRLLGTSEILAANCLAPIIFDDYRALQDAVNAIKADQTVISAAVYSPEGETLAKYQRGPETPPPPFRSKEGGVLIEEGYITVSHPIRLDAEAVGYLLILGDLSVIYTRLGDYSFVIFVVLLIAIVISFILSSQLGALVSRPIGYVAELARIVTKSNDYSLRVVRHTNDETGDLIDSINAMLQQIQERDRELLENKRDLEDRVEERTEALKTSQEQLRHSERVASIGTLAAGIAHEINNPLNSILMTAQYSLRSKDLSEISKKNFETIAAEARRCGKIIKSVLKFARAERTEKHLGDLNEVVEIAVQLASTYKHSAGLSVRHQLDPSLPQVLFNATELQQVLINLIQNAVDACGENGIIDVRTKRRDKVVEVVVRDNGPGIAGDHLSRIFDPFFSTKLNSGGTGLGLSIVHGIIADHEGTIRVESSLGHGTSFIINLPLPPELGRQRGEVAQGSSDREERAHVR